MYNRRSLAPMAHDLDIIGVPAEQQMPFGRKYRSDGHAVETAWELGEHSVARRCLLKPAIKTVYNAQRREHPNSGKSGSLLSSPSGRWRTGDKQRILDLLRAIASRVWMFGVVVCCLIMGASTILAQRPSRARLQNMLSDKRAATKIVEILVKSDALQNAADPVVDSVEAKWMAIPDAADRPVVPAELLLQQGEVAMLPDEAAIEKRAQALRAPVPSLERQSELRALLKNFDLANLPGIAQKQDAVTKLEEMSRDTGLSVDERFVVLNTLISVSIAASDSSAFLQAVDQLIADYDLDRHQEESRLLIEFMRIGKLGKQLHPVIERAAVCARSAADKNRFSEAMQLIAAADNAVRKASSLDQLKKFVTQAREAIVSREKAWKSFETAKQTLSTNPNDPVANSHVGIWHAIYQQDWPLALPFLVKAKDIDWKAAAELEYRSPTDATEQMAIGNAWYDIAQAITEKTSGAMRTSLLVHSGEWYERAVPNLTSALTRQTVTERLAMIAPLKAEQKSFSETPNETPGAQAGKWVDLLAWSEGVDWAPRGIDWNAHLDGPPTRRGMTLKSLWCNRFPLPALIEGNYELEMEFTRIDGDGSVSIFFPVLFHNLHLEIGKNRGGVDYVGWIDGERSEKSATAKQPSILTTSNRKHVVRIESHADGDQAQFRIDVDQTKNYIHWKGKYSSLANLEGGAWRLSTVRHAWIGAMQSRVRFDKIRVRMLSGTIRRDTVTDTDRARDLQCGLVRLIGVKPSAQSVGWSRFLVNQVPVEFGPGSAERAWPRIRGFSQCQDYYGAHAPSHVRCRIPAGAKSVSAVGYCDTESEAKYVVCFDGKVSSTSAATHVAVIKMDIPTDATFLDLIVDPAGSNAGDHTYWCNPQFHSVAANSITEEMIDGKPGPLRFDITFSSVGFQSLTHNTPIATLHSAPLNFRDAQPCDEFLFAHAPSSVIYEVPRGMSRFSAIGFNTISQHTKFEVWADEKRIFESPQAGIAVVDVKLPPGTKAISLKVNSLGDPHHDLSFWCYPRLHLK